MNRCYADTFKFYQRVLKTKGGSSVAA